MSNKTVVYDENKKQFSLEDVGSGGSGTSEMHRVLVTDGNTRTITDFKGTIEIVANDLIPLDSFGLEWNYLEDETRTLIIMFTVNCNNVTNTSINGVQLNRFPNSVKANDAWIVTYDKFYNSWDLVASNLVGTDRQIMGFVDGTQKPLTLGIKQLTDIAGFPSFVNGVFTATAINSVNQTALLSFQEFSTTTAKAGTFPTYGTSGVLVVGTATANNHAVTKAQLDAKPSIGTTATTAKRGDYAPSATEIVTAINAMTPEQVTEVQTKLGIVPTP